MPDSGRIRRANVVALRDIPGNVVTMNSRAVLIDLDTEEEMTHMLVFPHDADIDQGRISIFAPIGTAMLGYSVGDTFEWKVPVGLRRLEVKGILYQPEASGHCHLWENHPNAHQSCSVCCLPHHTSSV